MLLMCEAIDNCVSEDVFTVQAELIKKCIEEDKWYLSEQESKKLGHPVDVGWAAAEQHFYQTYLNGFAAGFRASFCGFVCPVRKRCNLAKKYIKD